MKHVLPVILLIVLFFVILLINFISCYVRVGQFEDYYKTL